MLSTNTVYANPLPLSSFHRYLLDDILKATSKDLFMFLGPKIAHNTDLSNTL
jgi:hypothetical protein